MCARLLACPLCSQPGFLTLDALRAGLVSVATRPLACPVCNEVLLGIDKLTIHLFGHTINQAQVVGGGSETAKLIEVRNAQTIQQWNMLNEKRLEESSRETTGSGIYIPIDEIENFRNLTAIKDASNVIPVNNAQNVTVDPKPPGQVIFLQNVSAQPKIITANLIGQTVEQQQPQQQQQPMAASISYQTVPTAQQQTTNELPAPMDQTCRQENNSVAETNEPTANVVISINGVVDKNGKESFTQTSWNENASAEPIPSPASEYPPSHTDRLADLVKNAQITASPLGNFHESFDCSKPHSPPDPSSSTSVVQPSIKSQRVLAADEQSERCNICGLHFATRNILILHKKVIHMIQEKDFNVAPEDLMKNYPCHICTKDFKRRGHLMIHMRVAHTGFNTNTNSASATVSEASQQKEQLKEKPKEPEPAPQNSEPENSFNCPICGKSFKKEQHVSQHLKIHDGKQWECDVCSKMFTTKYFLKKHKRLHSGEMPYKCSICDKTFTFQQSYHKHRFYHKDDKPHTCSTCGRSFKELSTLHNHERIHTGEKPFACESCGKCFRQRVSYLVHRRIHTGVMPYKCTSCGKNFRYKVSQRTHKCPQQPPGTPSTVVQQNSLVQQLKNAHKFKEMRNLQDEESMDTPSTSEENQYVFVMNDEGQHVLKRKLDIENTNDKNIDEGTIKQNKENTNGSNEFMQNIWNQDSSNGIDFKENNSKINDAKSNIITDTNLWNNSPNNKDDSQISDDSISKQFNIKGINNEFTNGLWNQTPSREVSYDKISGKNQSNNASDFFSMVMSPLENEISSPSTEMEHLRLSSPVNNPENSTEASDCFPPMNNSANAVQVDHRNIEEHFSENNVNLSTLQTINEDSLKELLYSITDK